MTRGAPWVTGRGACRYKVALAEGGNYTPRLPLLNGRMYDNELEQQYYAIFDINKVGATPPPSLSCC